ncbi:ribbon-helix-helix domain-containing protein [Devosia pacifica]|uniref:ribbon-helix-helix domain-containing protein n=1 Tax=Devosia pacifica TaxID=1335967 RepID=UPI001675E413|nr:ribbon-helix-helix domain-containing protein [Devosia pacifica]
MQKRSLTIAGHRTSIALEPEFWSGLDAVAAELSLSIPATVELIDQSRRSDNLSSAIRLAVLAWFRDHRLPRPAPQED